jgi:hypothetical protein
MCTDRGTLPWLHPLVMHEALAVGCCPHSCWTRLQGAGQQPQCVGPVFGPSSFAAGGVADGLPQLARCERWACLRHSAEHCRVARGVIGPLA